MGIHLKEKIQSISDRQPDRTGDQQQLYKPPRQQYDQLLLTGGGFAVTRHVVAGQQGIAGQAVDDVLVVVGDDNLHGWSLTNTLYCVKPAFPPLAVPVA